MMDVESIRARVDAEWRATGLQNTGCLTMAELDWVVGRAETLRELVEAGHVDEETVEEVEEAAAARQLTGESAEADQARLSRSEAPVLREVAAAARDDAHHQASHREGCGHCEARRAVFAGCARGDCVPESDGTPSGHRHESDQGGTE